MKYNKLIRDKIPEIIKNKRQVPITHIASEEEYLKKLNEKLQEEVKEFISDGNKEEMVDIIEIIYAIQDYKKFSREELELLRKKKAEEKGSFKKRIILDEIN